MIKAGTKRAGTQGAELGADDIGTIADYLTRAGDRARTLLEQRITDYRNGIEEDTRRIENYRSDIEHSNQQVAEYTLEIQKAEHDFANLPPSKRITAEEARADIARALALSFIKGIEIVRDNGKVYIVATTRENTLQTTFAHKFSKRERWYRSKPYKVFMPAYKIRVGTKLRNTLANNEEALALTLANYQEDTANWLDWINRYSHKIHAHWGTTDIASAGTWRAVCLGEYESEVSRAFKASIADGFVALATYLQASGAVNGYVHTREAWGLWIGKKEMNLAIVPSEKEVLGEEDDMWCDNCESDEHDTEDCEADRDDDDDNSDPL
jgi:hypothetical protein